MCQICDFKTKSKPGLKIHIQVKHKKTNDKKIHKCPKCDSSFGQLCHLNKHIKRGCKEKSEVKCNYCSYQSYRKYSLIEHLQKTHPESFSSKSMCNIINY